MSPYIVRAITAIYGGMPNLIVQITDDQAAWLNSRCDRFNTKARLIRDLIDTARYGLDRGPTLAERVQPNPEEGRGLTSGASTSIDTSITEETTYKKKGASKKRDPYSLKDLKADLIPEDLQPMAEKIQLFWSVKKGVRSKQASELLWGKLRDMSPSDQGKALDAAYNGQWSSVFPPKPNTPAHEQEPPAKHPAQRVFTADRGFLEHI